MQDKAVDVTSAPAVSYLFRSLGTVVWLSIGTTLMQDTLRHLLYQRISGENVDEVREEFRRAQARSASRVVGHTPIRADAIAFVASSSFQSRSFAVFVSR